MLIEQVDDIDLEPLERALDGLLDVVRLAVQPRRLSVFKAEPELCGNDHILADREKRFAHKFFIGEWPVGFCGIE